MFHSSELRYLRADVRANCEMFLALCKEAGLNVKVTETVRDDEHQRYLAANGYAAKTATVPTFHSVKAGLAFDVCKNMKGHEYDDADFFARVGAVGKELGFSWGGDWKAFPDRPHFQWDAHGAYTGAMVRAGRYPPPMPVYEEETMTQQQFNAMMENYLCGLADREPSAWSAQARAWAEENGILMGDETGRKQYKSFLTREQLVVILQRLQHPLQVRSKKEGTGRAASCSLFFAIL